ncbi:CDC42 small effector protein 2-like isoform X2 [Amphiura filiformis]|uniref:CDC42 small effector protein 2-like isoform X2 n=1 Tax=Amphiura filiformis TaxID=82378 RepID=UPI003B223AF7
MADLFVCFGCCVTEQPPPQRRRIDRSMIGLPTNFVHTGHIGSGDMAPSDQEVTDHLNCIQVQMKSKGGYEHTNPVSIERDVIEVQREGTWL